MTEKNALIECSEGQVCYDLAGPPDGDPVVFIHGLMGNKNIWSPLFEELSVRGFRVLRFDLYGRGGSDKPDIEYYLPIFIIQVLEVVETLGISKPFHLVGLSLGSLIAAAFTSEMREYVKDAALLSPAGLGVSRPMLVNLLMKEGVGEGITKIISSDPILRWSVKRFGGKSKQDMIHSAILKNIDDPTYRRAVLSTLRNVDLSHGAEHYSVLGKSRRPTLVIWGDEDRLVPKKLEFQMTELMPEANFISYSGVGHTPQIEVVNDVLRDMLKHWGREQN